MNLSDRVLSPAEKSVLELGVSFSPLNKNYDRILFATDFYEFVRRLKLCDYFQTLTLTTNSPMAIRMNYQTMESG